MTQDWEYNSLNLTTPAYTVQYLGASLNTPDKRGDNVVVPGKTGRLYTRKEFAQRSISLAMWVKDVDPATGSTASEAQLLANLDSLRQTFSEPGTHLLKHTMGGTVREAPAEILQAIEFEPFGTAPYYRYVVEFMIHGAVWRSENDEVIGPTTISSTPQNIGLSNPGTYQTEDGVYTIIGYTIDPRVTMGSYYVEYDGTVVAGGTLVINCNDFTC